MSDAPIQVIVAAFNTPDGASKAMTDLKEGKKEGLIGIIDAAVVVKDADGKLKIKDSKHRSTKGLITGGLVGGVLGILMGPVGFLALGGGAIGALAGKIKGSDLKSEMKDIGTALVPGSSAIVAAIEHKWVEQVEAQMAAEGAQVVRDSIKQDIAEQLRAGGNVLYTMGASDTESGMGRVAESKDGVVDVSGVRADEDGVYLTEAQLTNEQPISQDSTAEAPAPSSNAWLDPNENVKK
jgi:uncharacterized membrane protein